MPFISKIETRAYARATEITDRVVSSIQAVFPEHLRQDVSVEISKAEGQMGDTIAILSGVLEGQDRCEEAMTYIFTQMDKQSHRAIMRSLDIRLDDQCVFFLRIDKQAAFRGEVRLTDDVDVISVRFHFKQYPRCKSDDVMLLIKDTLQTAGGTT